MSFRAITAFYSWALFILFLCAIGFTYFQHKEYTGIVFTVILGLLAIYRQNEISKKTSTINLLTQQSLDRDLINDLKSFFKLAGKHDSFSHYKKKTSDSNPNHAEERAVIISILNYYEFIASGIREGALDYYIVHRYSRSNVLKLWAKCSTLVGDLRTMTAKANHVTIKQISIFKEIEKLAEDFEKHEFKESIWKKILYFRL